jgi:hypothetical protein
MRRYKGEWPPSNRTSRKSRSLICQSFFDSLRPFTFHACWDAQLGGGVSKACHLTVPKLFHNPSQRLPDDYVFQVVMAGSWLVLCLAEQVRVVITRRCHEASEESSRICSFFCAPVFAIGRKPDSVVRRQRKDLLEKLSHHTSN